MSRCRVYALIFILIGVVVMLHQLLFYGKVWEWSDALHHEWFAGIAIILGLGMLLGEKFKD